MSDRRQDDMAAQAWPGYVDILSATVIMFVFFVMVIVVVLYLYSIKFTATVQQQAEQKIQESIQQIETPETLGDLEKEKSKKVKEISDLEKQKQTIKQEVQALEKKVKQLSTGLEEGTEQSIIVNDKEIIVVFSDNAITLTNDTISSLTKFLELYPETIKIDITAGDNPLAVTQSSERQSILARMLNTRNVALEKGFEADQITINYVEPEQIENNYNWVRIRVE